MNYRILIFEMEFFLPAAASLKEKRALRQKLLARLKQRWSLSAIECGEQDSLSRLQIAGALACLSEAAARNAGRAILDAAEEIMASDGEMIRRQTEIV